MEIENMDVVNAVDEKENKQQQADDVNEDVSEEEKEEDNDELELTSDSDPE